MGRKQLTRYARPIEVRLDTAEDIAAHLDAALRSGDAKLVAQAMGDVARVRGISQIARETGLSRVTLYRSLSQEGNPELGTILKVLHALGLHLATRPSGDAPTPSINEHGARERTRQGRV